MYPSEASRVAEGGFGEPVEHPRANRPRTTQGRAQQPGGLLVAMV